ncbi:hypothetical protein [uncultured Selenomonas sp.]|uniref:hypothetical protein n=1 Tax=uncultured Selenomonas sp. TaxID=159275 RepID=UPI0025F64745|nr:hypothetical protein [uncultured Selenomonas sp.]
MELENFSERMSRILLFSPLYRLRGRKLRRKDGTETTELELGLMTLLFFFEHMLDGRKDAGIRELAGFLQDATNSQISDAFQDYEKLARDIVATFRPTTGRRNAETFFDWSAKQERTAEFSYLKADKVDVSSNAQYYVLDEQGLELVFATKEYFNEYQLSINQLILRKQLEKGQFTLALRQVEEMRLDVETLHGRITRIRREIHRSIVSEETLARYRKIVADLNERLKSEEDQFKELKDFIGETKRRIHDNIDQDPVQNALDSIMLVEQRLDAVHGKHRRLLQLGIELGTSALAAAEEALYFSGIDSFNFDADVTNRFFATPLPLTASRRLIEPFLPVAKPAIWSPVDIFAPQRLERFEREGRQEEFPEDEIVSENDALAKENLRQHYRAIVDDLLAHLADETETTLQSFIESEEERRPELLTEKQFYIFWMILHRHRTVLFDDDHLGEDSPYREIALQHPELAAISIGDLPGLIEPPGFTISNMNIKVEMNHGLS